MSDVRIFREGQRVTVDGRPGTVAYVTMAPPDFTRPAGVSVVMDDQRHRLDYAATIWPADRVMPAVPVKEREGSA